MRGWRIRHRLGVAILLTAALPLIFAILLARSMVQQSSERFFVPELRQRLDQSLGLYRELATEVKASMRYQATAIAANGALRRAVAAEDEAETAQQLKRLFKQYPQLVSLSVELEDGAITEVDRGHPVDPKTEHRLVVERPLAESEDGPLLTATFATERARFERLDEMSQFVNAYSQLEQRRESDEGTYVLAFAILLSLTIFGAGFVGVLLARGVATRLSALSVATQKVGTGDLSVRVADQGSDEIGQLAGAFNQMLSELEESRTRIEYLNRIATWQELARRMAHEIKNPLTPIQLAVQEIHQRYSGADAAYSKLLGTTLEIVEAEVGTLRRLVSEFSDFARLPRAHLEPEDLFEVLRDYAEQIELVERRRSDPAPGQAAHPVDVEFSIPDGEAPVDVDVQLFRRALDNLVQNAIQAVRHAEGNEDRVSVKAELGEDSLIINVEDSGPGVPAELKDSIFDPYFTTKSEGTGLGLAIVKKIVVEHGGRIEAQDSELGGARFEITLPLFRER